MDFFGEPLETPEEAQATELCYDAMETNNYFRKIELANFALSTYPNSVEAWGILGYCSLHGPADIRNYEQALSYYEKSIQLGAISIGRFAMNGVIRWGIIKNRAYLRSIHGKILTLEKLGRFSEEMFERERLLAMEPEDHLQVRYRVMQSKMSSQDFVGLATVLNKFKDENMFPFVSYTTVLLSYYQINNKFSTGTLVDQDSQAAVLRAVECNPYVSNLLFRPNYDYHLPEEQPGYSSSEGLAAAKDYLGYYLGRQMWQQFPGSLNWLHSMIYPSGVLVPSASDLMELLAFRYVLMTVIDRGDIFVTRCKRSMIGSATPTFHIPDHFDSTSQSQICVFENSPGWKNNGFKIISYDKIVSVLCWEPLLGEVRKDNTPIPCPPYLCTACHDPLPALTRAKTYESQEYANEELKSKSLKCEDCRAKRYAAHLCEQCNSETSQRCSKCREVYYCSRECLKANWSIHKRSCIRRNTSENMRRLANAVFSSDILTYIIGFLVGSGSPASALTSLDIIRITSVNKGIRNKLRSVSLWTHLSIRVDLSAVCMNYDVYTAPVEDNSWRTLKTHPQNIIGTFIRYGGSRITSLALRLPVLDDSCLHVIATGCPLLSRIELRTSALVSNEGVFPTPSGLANFFALVPPLITHLMIVKEECTTRTKHILPKSVLHAIRSRQFPLEALSLDLTKQTVKVLAPTFVNLRALQLICMHSSSSSGEEEVAGSSLMDSLSGRVFQKMTILSLLQMKAITDGHMKIIAAAMPHLRDLDIGIFTKDSSLTDAGLQALSQCRSLRCLDISGRSSITLDGLLHMLQRDHPMRELTINDTAICNRCSGSLYRRNGMTIMHTLMKIIECAPSIVILAYSDPEIPHAYGPLVMEVSRKMQPLMMAYPNIFFCHPSIGIVKPFGQQTTESCSENAQNELRYAQYGLTSSDRDKIRLDWELKNP
eukprot:gene32915-42600_t